MYTILEITYVSCERTYYFFIIRMKAHKLCFSSNKNKSKRILQQLRLKLLENKNIMYNAIRLVTRRCKIALNVLTIVLGEVGY